MRIKLICFDLDGTVVENVTAWETIHDYFKVDSGRRAEAKRRFFDGEISYTDWAHHDVGMWVEKRITKKKILEAIGKIRLMPGARETLLALRKKGIKMAIISGSLDVLLEKTIPDYREIFDYVFITKLIFDKKGLVTGSIPTWHDYEHKATALRDIAKKENISLKETAFVGDHDNDVEIAKAAGFSIAFNSKSKQLNLAVDVVIKKKDLREILQYILK
ncbi:HAD family phosphatase [Candidatus Woesearchaeota archaeon]|nr:HAD family phosphatase [Candidatus Woesearchaeota archaeon]